MALWKSWLLLVGLGVFAGEIHTLLGEENQGDNDEATLPPPSSPSYFDSEPLPESNTHHPLPSSPLQAQQVQGQEESGVTVLLAICAASFFSVYVIYSLFGRKKERRRGTELRTYSQSVNS